VSHYNAGGKELADLWQPIPCRKKGYEGYESDLAWCQPVALTAWLKAVFACYLPTNKFL
jgi:hypothetical protein